MFIIAVRRGHLSNAWYVNCQLSATNPKFYFSKIIFHFLIKEESSYVIGVSPAKLIISHVFFQEKYVKISKGPTIVPWGTSHVTFSCLRLQGDLGLCIHKFYLSLVIIITFCVDLWYIFPTPILCLGSCIKKL